jgi:sugar O-acyltransferase (sialic acid O-acetyltransferase NeuD family)
MKFIHGVSGFAKEVDWLIYDIYQSGGVDYRPDYFVCEDGNPKIGTQINGCEIIGDANFNQLVADGERHECFLGVGSPIVRQKLIARMLLKNRNIAFPNLIHPSVCMDRRDGKVRMGMGAVICAGSILTTDIVLGDFVHVNLDSTIGHDSVIGSYSTLSPGSHISGNVTLMERIFIGTGASVIEGVSLHPDVVIGAGAAVIKDLVEQGTYVGIPAKMIK